MPAAIGPRFVLEAGFLILLAVVVGLADLSPALIVLVMLVGWLLVALIEYFAWRQSPGHAAVTRYAMPDVPPEATVHEEIVEEVAPPPPPPPVPAPPPVEEETIVAPPGVEAPPAEGENTAEAEDTPAQIEDTTTFKPERLIVHSLEPLKPRPSRRWIIFGPRVRREDDREEER